MKNKKNFLQKVVISQLIFLEGFISLLPTFLQKSITTIVSKEKNYLVHCDVNLTLIISAKECTNDVVGSFNLCLQCLSMGAPHLGPRHWALP